MLVSFDPASLVTTDDELLAVIADFAERRIGFTEAWLARSGLTATIATVQAATAQTWGGTGVDPSGIAALTAAGFTNAEIHFVFVHPDIIAAAPSTLTYYRRLVSMSNKVFQRLFPRLWRIIGRDHAFIGPPEQAEIERLNQLLSNVARQAGLTPADPERLVVLSEGGAIDGDWRNQIGRVATWGAFEAMLQAVPPHEMDLARFVRDGEFVDVLSLTRSERAELIDSRWRPHGFEANGHRVVFGAQRVGNVTVDADITVARLAGSASEVVEAAGEVKGSTDPANAMERWRLASRNIESMNQIRSGRASRRPTTFYVGIVITENVVEGSGGTVAMRTLLQNSTLDTAFSIVKLEDATEQARFAAFFRPQLGLP